MMLIERITRLVMVGSHGFIIAWTILQDMLNSLLFSDMQTY